MTRLTDSGLSMVDWQPIMGALPPFDDAEWQDTFDKYKQYPQYQKLNRKMELEGFKEIFYWEYGHRLLGRLIGVIFFIPFVILLLLRKIEKPLIPKLSIALVLGGLQGLMGWYMVMSGLVDIPRVSHYRLAAHLLLALLILAWLFWLILDLLERPREEADKQPAWSVMASRIFLGIVMLQITYGAFTAGLRAGFGYNTFPLMNEKLIADAVFLMNPWWINLFESGATVQFIHRWIGVITLIAITTLWILTITGRYDKKFSYCVHGLFLVTLTQFLVGVLTLVYVVPIALASAHQAFACLVLLVCVYFVYITKNLPKDV